MQPYYQDNLVTLYHGDMRDVLPAIEQKFDACITDPPYEQTSLKWDRWPEGWPTVVSFYTNNLWCFGSLRMFMEQRLEFPAWQFAQDIVWEKQNGTCAHNDRFRRIHEQAAQFYRGPWSEIYKSPVYTMDAVARRVIRRVRKPEHWGNIGEHHFNSETGGKRLERSVIPVKNCHPHALHPTQKPAGILAPLIQYSVPPGGALLDCFAGSGESLITAKKLGIKSVGIELQREYCDLIVRRFSQQSLDIVEADVCSK